jgi:hypothetical protein
MPVGLRKGLGAVVWACGSSAEGNGRVGVGIGIAAAGDQGIAAAGPRSAWQELRLDYQGHRLPGPGARARHLAEMTAAGNWTGTDTGPCGHPLQETGRRQKSKA